MKMVDDGKIAETRLGMKVRKWLPAYKETDPDGFLVHRPLMEMALPILCP